VLVIIIGNVHHFLLPFFQSIPLFCFVQGAPSTTLFVFLLGTLLICLVLCTSSQFLRHSFSGNLAKLLHFVCFLLVLFFFSFANGIIVALGIVMCAGDHL
jgi:hypothetical protein